MKQLICLWGYLKRSHPNHLIYSVSFINYVAITSILVFVILLGFPKEITCMAVYGALFTLAYFAIAVMIGRWGFRGRKRPSRNRANSWVNDLSKALILMVENKQEEAIKVLEKWVGG